MSDFEDTLNEFISPIMESLGYRLVRVRMAQHHLQIMAEHQDYTPLTLDDCVKISHHLSAVLDAEDPIKGKYYLEVSSCGIERPLTSLQDIAFFKGRGARFVLTLEDKKTSLTGIIQKVQDENIEIKLYDDAQDCYSIDWNLVKKAHLIDDRNNRTKEWKKQKKNRHKDCQTS